MGLRDPLVSMEPGESSIQEYLDRCFAEARRVTDNPLPRIRAELIYNLFGAGRTESQRQGISLWFDRETSRSESWQRLSVTIFGGYAEVLAYVARAAAQ